MNRRRPFTPTAGLILAMLLITAKASSQVRIHIRPYLGVGYSRTLDDYTPSFAVEDTLDQVYYTLNLADPPKNSLRGQARIDVLELGNLRLGYFLWAHRVEYSDKTPDNFIQVEKYYPHSHYYHLQGLSLAWNLDYPSLANRYRLPFLAGGIGKYWGYVKDYYYLWVDEAHSQADLHYQKNSLNEDWGYFLGVGMTFVNRLYVYAGMTQLLGDGLPGSRFLDFVIGVTF